MEKQYVYVLTYKEENRYSYDINDETLHTYIYGIYTTQEEAYKNAENIYSYQNPTVTKIELNTKFDDIVQDL